MNVAQSPFQNSDIAGYDHCQTAPLYWLMLLPAIVLAVCAINANDAATVSTWLVISGILVLSAMSFMWLRVHDEGQCLVIRFGPLPVFRKRIPYLAIAAAAPDRSSWVDGWGIHWVIGRGWIFNLWGFQCVRLTLANGKAFRIGTDDPNGLSQFLNEKLQSANGSKSIEFR